MPHNTVPLNRALSKLGLLSRAQATEAVAAGRVRVDGRVTTDPLARVIPERARIVVDGVQARRREWRTILVSIGDLELGTLTPGEWRAIPQAKILAALAKFKPHQLAHPSPV